jgi:hypothetical protein
VRYEFRDGCQIAACGKYRNGKKETESNFLRGSKGRGEANRQFSPMPGPSLRGIEGIQKDGIKMVV